MSKRVIRRAKSHHDEPRPAKDPSDKNVFHAPDFPEPGEQTRAAQEAPQEANAGESTAAEPEAKPAPADGSAASAATPAPSSSFADLFEQADSAPQATRPRPKVGDQVEGSVAHVGESYIFVDLGPRLQGSFSRIDFEGRGRPLPAVGDRLAGVVVEVDSGGEIRLGQGLGEGASLEQLQQAFESGQPVEGKVSGVNKGGVTVTIGRVRCFCPISQLDSHFVDDASRFIGQTLEFLITEIGDRDVVLSRKSLLASVAHSKRDELAASLTVGASLDGRVSSVRDFGAFVDLGGVDGLIPTRELSHERGRAADVVSIGDAVKVRVLEVQGSGEDLKITLSLKALAADPWDAIDAVAPVGRVVAGTVSSMQDFGAFVRLGPGLEGLLHISQLPASVQHPKDALEAGQQVLVEVQVVDKKRKRIGLALADDGAKAGSNVERRGAVLGEVVKAEVVQIERYGVFVQIEGTKGRDGRGLIPMKELGLPFGNDVRKDFPIGTVVQAKVLETGERRLRLSVTAAAAAAERAVFDAYKQETAGQSMGSFGDLLKAQLKGD